MKILSKFKVRPLILLGIVALIIIAPDLKGWVKYRIQKMLYKNEYIQAQQDNIDHGNNVNQVTKSVKFDKDGIENIALITMIKDEEDIIYENLVWHFCIGFRKFVVVDNNSSDKTRFLVEKFRDKVASIATVIIVDDPIVEYIQSKVTTGAMLLAKSIWPKVDWIFPVDGDEFWYPTNKLKDVLIQIPDNKDVVVTQAYNHRPIKASGNYEFSVPFYDNLNFRLKALGVPKVAVRAHLDIVIAQGNHSAEYHSAEYHKKSRIRTRFIGGNKLGLDMRHFEMRSVNQVMKKYGNGSKANILAQKLGLIPESDGVHWTSFEKEMQEKGIENAAIDRFNGSVSSKEDCVQDPLPMREAMKLFEELTAK